MNKLKEIISKEGINIDKLADDIGISYDHLQNWINGNEKPIDEDEQEALIQALQLQTSKQYLIEQLFYEVAGLGKPVRASTSVRYYGGGDVFDITPQLASSDDRLRFILDQGSAPNETIADILSDLSILYRMKGGSGINFEPSGIILTASHE
jgi:transcriptional regulator with XRE-family HTH domain